MGKLSVNANGQLLESIGLLAAMKASNKIMNLTKSFHRFVENPAKAIPAAFNDPVKIREWINEYAQRALNPEGLHRAASAITEEKIEEEVIRMRSKLSKEVLNNTQAEQLAEALTVYESSLRAAVRNAMPLVQVFAPKDKQEEAPKQARKKSRKETVVVE